MKVKNRRKFLALVLTLALLCAMLPVSAFAEGETYSVAIDSAITGGSLTADPSGGIEGTTVTVTVTPDEGKQLAPDSLKYTADGGGSYTPITETGGVYSFTLPAADVIVTAQFEDIPAVPETYSVTIDGAISGGTLTADPVSGTEGTTVTVTVTPDEGKRLVAGSLQYTADEGITNTAITETAGVYSFLLPAADVTVKAQFEDIPAAPDTYNVTVDSAVTGGSVAVDPASGAEGTAITVTVTPDEGKQLAAGSLQYTADEGITNTAITETAGVYSFLLPAADVTVTAQFEDIPPAPVVWDGSIDVSWYNAVDTEFTVTNAAQFAGLAAIVNNKQANSAAGAVTGTNPAIPADDFLGKTVYLASDLDLGGIEVVAGGLSGTTWTTPVWSGQTWEPIGTYTSAGTSNNGLLGRPFKGTFDGQFHTISNIYIPGDPSAGYDSPLTNSHALFGDFGHDAVAKNIIIKSGYIRGARYSAGIAGRNWGYVANCANYATIETDGDRSGGGITGVNYENTPGDDYTPTVINCYNAGTIMKGDQRWSGGITGDNEGIIENCYNIGTGRHKWTLELMGGIVGQGHSTTKGQIINCYSLSGDGQPTAIIAYNNSIPAGSALKTQAELQATTYGPGDILTLLGAAFKADSTNSNNGYPILSGQGGGDIPPTTYSVTVDSVITGGSVAVDPASGAEGTAITVTVTPDEGKQLAAGSLQYTADGGITYTAITETEGVYSFLLPAANVTVTAQFEDAGELIPDIAWYVGEGPYYIANANQLAGLAQLVNGGNDFAGKTIYLSNNIVLDGNGKYTATPETVFGTASYNIVTTWYDVNDDARIWTPIGTGTSTAANTIATANYFAGTFDGAGYTVSGLYTDGEARVQGLFSCVTGTIKNLTVSGCVTAHSIAGGVAAYLNGGTIENCVNNAIVFIDGGTTPNGGIEDGLNRAGANGGIAGLVSGQAAVPFKIADCVNNGVIIGANSWQGGRTGGIAGLVNDTNDYGSFSNCFNTEIIDAYQYAGGIVGMNYSSHAPIDRCANQAKIQAQSPGSTYVGGIVAYSSSPISNCYNTGNVNIRKEGTANTKVAHAGGIVSDLINTTVTNCYNTGALTWQGYNITAGCSSYGTIAGTGYGYVGGIRLFNCYTTVTTNAEDYAYISNQSIPDALTLKTNDEMKAEAILPLLNGDGRAFVKDGTPPVNSGYPILRGQMVPADTATVTSITKESDPTKLSYVEGQTFDPAGLAIWANYSDDSREKVTNYTISKTTALETADTTITVSGSYGGFAYSYDFTITVAGNELAGIAITTPPANVLYASGETFNPAGMAVRATFTNGSTANLAAEQYTISPTVLAPADTQVTVSYTYAGVTRTADQPVTVLASAPPALNGDIYELANADHMLWFANQVNTGTNTAAKGKLMNDIDLSSVTWTPIGSSTARRFAGVFDGNGKTVTLAISGSAGYTGLFGYVNGGTVKDLTVAGSVSGSQYVAGVAAYVNGASVIQNCVNNAAVTSTGNYAGGITAYAIDTTAINGCVNNGAVNSTSFIVGGIAGYTAGTAAVSDCVNTGAVTGTYHVGGIVGNGYGANAISRCANTGAITATNTAASAAYSAGGIVGYSYAAINIDQCYNSGAVSGGVMNVGGVAGYLNNTAAALTNSYNTGSVTSASASATARTGGVVGTSNNANCTVRNTYNAGAVTGNGTSNHTAGVIGYANNTNNISNNYYLNTTAGKGLGNAADNAVSKTSAEMKSAAFTVLLGEAYVMKTNAYPVLAWQGSPQAAVTLSLSPTAAQPGETVTASGTAPANTWISLKTLDVDQNIVVFDAVKSDSQGNYSLSFTVPEAGGEALTVIAGYGINIAEATLSLKLNPPALTADTSNNVVGQSIDITFSTDAQWQAAVSSIAVNGSPLTAEQYTVSAGNINISAGVFGSVGDYSITVTAGGYKDASVTQAIQAKTPPTLTADSSDNVVGQAIDLTFAENADWQSSVSGITINGSPLTVEQYTVSAGNINIAAGAFSAAGSYEIIVAAANYTSATVVQEILGAAPELTADITNNSPGQAIEITFAENEAWRNAITDITVDGASIAGKYTAAAGVITLDSTVFTEPGSYSVAVKATGYADATVTQAILNPCYLITPEIDQIYVISETQDGIKIMTVNAGVSGMKYFNVGVTPVRSHNGKETLVFVHLKDGQQASLNTSIGDFDLIDGGGAGFNVGAGDAVKVYMVDQLTNAIDFNPTIFQ